MQVGRSLAMLLVWGFLGPRRRENQIYCGVQISWCGGFFRYFFSITLIFLRLPCLRYRASTTYWTGLIPMALLWRCRVLAVNIEFSLKFAL